MAAWASVTGVMGDRRLPLPSFGLTSKGQGGQGPLSLGLFHPLLWESQHPEDKFNGVEPLGACPAALRVPWATEAGQRQQGLTRRDSERGRCAIELL